MHQRICSHSGLATSNLCTPYRMQLACGGAGPYYFPAASAEVEDAR
jgi:hypothetical protein